MFTSSRGVPATPTTARGATVAVDVSDPDLRADVRAVLAAVGLEEEPPGVDGGCPLADVVVTDRPDSRTAPGRRRVVVVCGDGEGSSDADRPTGAIALPSGLATLVDALGAVRAGGDGTVVAVTGAVGGCGTSTFAVALAARAGALLVDADPCGAGIDLLVGLEDRTGLRIDEVRSDLGTPEPAALAAAAPGVAGVTVLSRARGSARVGESLGTTAAGIARSTRSDGGVAVLDAGTLGPDGAGSPVVATADRVVVVTRADLAGALALSALVAELGDRAVPVIARRGAVEAADVAELVGRRVWGPVWSGAVGRAAADGILAERIRSGRRGGFRRLTRVADGILREVGVDARA